MSKEARHQKIVEILNSAIITNQEDLQEELKLAGFLVTQATLSRDLKYLRVIKSPADDGGFRYKTQDSSINIPLKVLPDQLEGVVSIEFSGQLGVMKTLPGFASAVAYYLDQLKLQEIMGTIAGDDTILVIAREGISKNLLAGKFSKYFKGLQHKML